VWYKEVPLQAWSGPEGSRKLRFPNFMTTAQDGGKVVCGIPGLYLEHAGKLKGSKQGL
jgi:hypothetical protein